MIVPQAEVSVRSKGRTRGIVWGGPRQGKRDVGGVRVPDQKDAAVEHLQLLVQQAGCQIRGDRHPACHAGKHAGAPMAVGTILLCSTRCLHSRQCGAGLPLSEAQLPDRPAQGVRSLEVEDCFLPAIGSQGVIALQAIKSSKLSLPSSVRTKAHRGRHSRLWRPLDLSP